MQAQNTLYLALNTIFGNQPSFLFNFFQKVWQDSANGFVRVGLLTYTTVSVNSLNEVRISLTSLKLHSPKTTWETLKGGKPRHG